LSLSSALEEKKLGNDDKPLDSLSFAAKEKNVENDNKLGGSLLSSATEAKQPRTTTSRDFDLSLSSTLEKETK
jgi:hypothetical protein